MMPLKKKVHNRSLKIQLLRQLIPAALFLVFIAAPAKSQQGWVATQVAPAGQDLNTVYFLDNKRGWVGAGQ